MAGMTNFLEAQILNLLLRTQVAWKPGAIWVGIYTTAPTDAGGGVEVSGGAYGRVQVAQLDANWDAPAGAPRATQNTGVITFPTATADWGLVVAFGLFDAATAGNLLIWNNLTVSRSVPNGATATFAAGALDVVGD
jgi:hypothetical protein